MRILVLSDTHIPRVAHDLPQVIYDEAKGCDMIIHAGDFVEKEFFEKLKATKELKAVYGNMDAPVLRHLLNAKEIVHVGRFRVGIIHGYGPPRDMLDTVRSEFADVNAIVFGHSHYPINIVQDGVLMFNPGSPTDTVYTKVNSYGMLEVTDKKIEGRIVKILP